MATLGMETLQLAKEQAQISHPASLKTKGTICNYEKRLVSKAFHCRVAPLFCTQIFNLRWVR